MILEFLCDNPFVDVEIWDPVSIYRLGRHDVQYGTAELVKVDEN